MPMRYNTLFIDLDETIYSAECGVWEAISKRMEKYMHERLNMNLEKIPMIRKSLYQTYGTTLRGLQETRKIDEREFLAYVHDVPLELYLAPDPELRAALQQLPQKKIIFTNADRAHAERVLKQMQLEGCFDVVIDIIQISPYCKPMPESFQIALKVAGENDPGRCVFIDDSPQNLSAARDLGFYTIQVGTPKPGYVHPESQAHERIAVLSHLPAVPHLLDERQNRAEPI